MIRIGDYVKIDNIHYDVSVFKWYTNETYQVINIVENNEVLILDRIFKDDSPTNRLHIDYAMLDVNATQFNKIKSILND